MTASNDRQQASSDSEPLEAEGGGCSQAGRFLPVMRVRVQSDGGKFGKVLLHPTLSLS